MYFAARSWALSQRAVGRHAFRRGRPLRQQQLRHHASSQSLTLSTAQPATVAAGKLPLLVGGLVCGIAGVWMCKKFSSTMASPAEAESRNSVPWHETFASGTSLVKVGSPRQVLKTSPLTKNLIQQDNLFDKMMEVQMVKDIHCYYDPRQKEFHSVVHLGKEVCGYPNTVHGGLTAAIVDETFGGLMFNIWRSGELGLALPAVTARLEVDYINRLPQNSTVLCTTRLEKGKREGRSFWMEAELCDQTREVTYATARACFVSPSLSKSAAKWFKGIAGL